MDEVAEFDVTEVVAESLNETRNVFHVDEILSYFTPENIVKIAVNVLTILLFLVVYKIIKKIVKKHASKKLEKKTVSLILKCISYIFYVLITMYVLGLFGIKLSAVWGAAGIAGVAVGFAAQTSVSNLISGLFVVTEKTMKPGDFIEIDGISGTVESVGFLAIKVRTADNHLVRVPNSTVINSNLKNFSFYDYRKHVLVVPVDYDSDLEKTLEILRTIPASCPTVIKDNPDYAYSVNYSDLGDYGVDATISVWCKRQDLLQTKNDLCINTMKICNENNIEIPYNRLEVYQMKD